MCTSNACVHLQHIYSNRTKFVKWLFSHSDKEHKFYAENKVAPGQILY